MKLKFKELPIFWKQSILILILVVMLLMMGLGLYIWSSVGELFMVMF